MKKNTLKILVANFICFGIYNFCLAQNNQLNNTKWVFMLGDCEEFIEFDGKGNYKKNSCEVDGIRYGKFSQKRNEVILDQLGGSFDENFPKDDPHRTDRVKYKLIITGNKMHYVEKWDLNIFEKWVKDNSKFSEEYVFEKAEK
jgi:hypothetical protein